MTMGTKRATPSAAWRELAESEDLDDAEEVASMLDDASTEQLGSLVGDVVERVVGVLLKGAPVRARQHHFARLTDGVARASKDKRAIPADGRGMLAGATLLACFGGQTNGPAPGTLVGHWAPKAKKTIKHLEDDVLNDWALACAAHGHDDLVDVFLASSRGPTGPGELARQVVAAARDGKDKAAVRKAWATFIEEFPSHYDDRGVLLSSLLHAGWAMHVRLGRGEPQGVPAEIEALTGLSWRRARGK